MELDAHSIALVHCLGKDGGRGITQGLEDLAILDFYLKKVVSWSSKGSKSKQGILKWVGKYKSVKKEVEEMDVEVRFKCIIIYIWSKKMKMGDGCPSHIINKIDR